jgi:adenosylhomocysteine nucleosidase
MDHPPRVAILAALMPEMRAIERAVGGVAGVEVHLIGLNATRIPAIAPGTLVIVAGLAGALDPALRVGDLVLDTPVADLPAALPWRLGAIHTADHLITMAADKAALFRQTGAIAVDMEQAAVRRALPNISQIIGLRAISDPADMALDPAVVGMIDSVGRPRPLAVISTLARRPGLIPHLRELNANSKLALRNLGLGVKALVDRFAPAGDSR